MLQDCVCLMYHDVSARDSLSQGGAEFFSVTQRRFARHLQIIRDAGLTGCSLAGLVPNADHVAISFDDGNVGQAAQAFPALVAAGMTATFFVTTGWIGRPGFASWEQLREMRAAGMAIESHTHTHPFLSELSEPQLRDELRRSRDLLQEHLGSEAPSMLALPGGDAPRRSLRRIIAEEGFSTVATSRWGKNRGDLGAAVRYVRRCTVRDELNDQEFLEIISGNSWLGMRKHTREAVLAFVRRSLGPTRYAKYRRQLLDSIGA